MNVSGKPHIQNIDVIVHKLQFLLKRGRASGFLDIIAKKICHPPKIVLRPVCSLQRSELRAGIETVEQKMRVDLRLQEV